MVDMPRIRFMDLIMFAWNIFQDNRASRDEGGTRPPNVIKTAVQGLSIWNPYNDESIIIKLETKLSDKEREKWHALLTELGPDGSTKLRKIIANITMPPRYASVVSEEISGSKDDNGKNQPPLRRFVREQVNYEGASYDPRLQVIKMFARMDTEAAKARVGTLLSEQSLLEQAEMTLEKWEEGIFRFFAALRLGDQYDDGMEIGELLVLLRKEQAARKRLRKEARARRTPLDSSTILMLIITGLIGAGAITFLVSQ